MPSARIMTRVVEDAVSLAEDLRTRGFAVQIVSPGDVPTGPVDLEVTLEECEPEAALHRADDVPDAEDLCVFVAPGALTDGPRPIRVVSLIPEIPPVVARPASVPVPAPLHETPEVSADLEEARIEDPAWEDQGEEMTAAAVSSLMNEDTVAAAPPVEPLPVFPRSVEASARAEKAEPREVPPVSLPVSKRPSISSVAALAFQELGAQLASWTMRMRGDEKLLLKAATVSAMGAVITLSVLVLGSTAHRLDPLPPAGNSANALRLPPAASTAAGSSPRQATKAAPPKPRAASPAKVLPKPAVNHAHNPEEDVVAQDFVIRYNQRPSTNRTQARKNSVKYYSDLHR